MFISDELPVNGLTLYIFQNKYYDKNVMFVD